MCCMFRVLLLCVVAAIFFIILFDFVVCDIERAQSCLIVQRRKQRQNLDKHHRDDKTSSVAMLNISLTSIIHAISQRYKILTDFVMPVAEHLEWYHHHHHRHHHNHRQKHHHYYHYKIFTSIAYHICQSLISIHGGFNVAGYHIIAVMNKLHSVKPVLGEWQSFYRRCRKDEVVLCRARIGHTHLTHSYILRKDPPPQCEHCQCILTVRHILVECNHFDQERKDIFGRRDVVESFRFQPTLIVLFLKQIKFYYTF